MCVAKLGKGKKSEQKIDDAQNRLVLVLSGDSRTDFRKIHEKSESRWRFERSMATKYRKTHGFARPRKWSARHLPRGPPRGWIEARIARFASCDLGPSEFARNLRHNESRVK